MSADRTDGTPVVRVVIPLGGESGSNGPITPRAGFDSRAPLAPSWPEAVAVRVAEYRARKADGAYRREHGLALEQGAKGGARPKGGPIERQARLPAGSACVTDTPAAFSSPTSSWLPVAAPRRWLVLLVWLVAAGLAVLLEPAWRAVVALAIFVAALIVAALIVCDAIPPERRR